jgi:hypothetical protein
MGANGMATNWIIEPKVYYIKTDEKQFIKDIIQYDPKVEAYKQHIIETAIPYDVLWGYYQFIDETIVLNEELKAIYDEANKIIEPEIVEEELKTEE